MPLMLENVLASPEFWVAVSFFVFVLLLFKPVRSKVLDALDSRSESIRREIDEASRLVEEAQSIFAGYQKKYRESAHECDNIIDHAHEKAAGLSSQAKETLHQSLEARQRQASARILQAEAEAIREIRDHAAEVTIAAAEKFLRAELSDKDKSRLIKAAVKEIPGHLH